MDASFSAALPTRRAASDMLICAVSPLTCGWRAIASSAWPSMTAGSAPTRSMIARRLPSPELSSAFRMCTGMSWPAFASVAMPTAACSASWAVTAHLSSLMVAPFWVAVSQ